MSLRESAAPRGTPQLLPAAEEYVKRGRTSDGHQRNTNRLLHRVRCLFWRRHFARQLTGPLLFRFVSPSSLFNRHEILFRNPHGHSRHTADYLRLMGLAERPGLLTGMGMRNESTPFLISHHAQA